MGLVNYSIPFARAVGDIVALHSLAETVAFRTGFKALIANKYVQPLGLRYEEKASS